MNLKIFMVLTAALVTQCAVSQQEFDKALQKLFSRPQYKNMSAGIHVVNISSGETIYFFNNEKLLIPASTLKLVTSAVALEMLGHGYRFKTWIGYTGKINNGILKGDLVIRGGGDPALGSEYFKGHYFNPHFLQVWAQQVKAAGIRKIEGGLIMDETLYDSEKIPPTWIWEDMGNYYGVGTSALTIYDNLFRITFRSPAMPQKPTEIIAVYPNVPGLQIKNEVLSSNENRDLAYVFGSPIDQHRIIRGTIPLNRRAFTIKASNPFPGQLMAEDFLQHLLLSGVFVSGKTTFAKVDPKAFQTIFIQESPVLPEIVKVMNTESVNLFAGHLVKQIAVEFEGKGDREAGLNQINNFLRKQDLDTNQIVMEDGSGLSHFNLASPGFFTGLLSYMANSSQNSSVFMNSLPTVGEGTLYNLHPGLFPQNSLRAKSGSMSRVCNYVGYLNTDSGQKLAFSFLFNHFSDSHSMLIQEIEALLLNIKRNN
jgi:serine-type D-Ala-D-Ala carboxypeptidase/endopeptidase (penicillin-binding protein 4)